MNKAFKRIIFIFSLMLYFITIPAQANTGCCKVVGGSGNTWCYENMNSEECARRAGSIVGNNCSESNQCPFIRGVCCSYYAPGGGVSGNGEECDDNFHGTIRDCIRTAKRHAGIGPENSSPNPTLEVRYGRGHCNSLNACIDENDELLPIIDGPLAIQLPSFTAKQVENGIELNWEANETLVAVNIWRAQQDEEGVYFDIVKLNEKVVYSNTFIDNTAQVGIKFFYGLETIDHAGLANLDVGNIISAIRK